MKHSVKGLLGVLVVAATLAVLWLQYSDFLTEGSRAPEGTQILNRMVEEGVPDFTLIDIEGESFTLSDYDDKVILLNFWASWCEPCVAEFPSMMRLIRRFPERVLMVAVSADHNKEEMQAFLKVFEADEPNLRVMWDRDMEVAGLYGTRVLPESYIIGRNLRLVRKIAGVEDWDTPMARSFFGSVVESEFDEQTESMAPEPGEAPPVSGSLPEANSLSESDAL